MAESVLSVGTVLLHILLFIVRPFHLLKYWRKPSGVPPIKNSLLKVSATSLAKKIRNGELSSETVVAAYIERIKEVEPLLNAVVEDRFEAALEDAKICDARLRSGEIVASILEKEKPLYGVPVTIKETCSLKDMSLTAGCVNLKGAKATEDGEAVKLLKNAGAIPLLVTNIPELCSSVNSFNYLYGQTLNPYDRRKSPGGSSGGEGALIASGASLIGLGSDLLGSIRLPSHFNGIFGHKPTPGIVPIKGHLPIIEDEFFQKLLVLGPLTRYVEDLYLSMKVLSSKNEKILRFDEPVQLKNLRVFYLDNIDSFCGTRSTNSSTKRTIREAKEFLARNGARVKLAPRNWLNKIFKLEVSMFAEVDLAKLFTDPKKPNERRTFLEFAKSMIGLSDYTRPLLSVRMISERRGFISTSEMEKYKRIREDLRREVNETLKDDGVFICPTYPCTAEFPEYYFFQNDYTCYCAIANFLQLPSTHVPMGLDDKGMPIGFQVIAASYQDHLCLAVAKEFENAFGGWIPPS